MCGFGELLKVGINLVVLVMSFWTGEEDGGSAPFCERWQRYECRPGAALLFLLLASFFFLNFVGLGCLLGMGEILFLALCRIRQGLKRNRGSGGRSVKIKESKLEFLGKSVEKKMVEVRSRDKIRNRNEIREFQCFPWTEHKYGNGHIFFVYLGHFVWNFLSAL